MNRRLLGLLFCLVVSASSYSAQAQGEKVELQLKLARGETLAYDLSGSQQVKATLLGLTVLGVSRASDSAMQALEMQRVLDVGPDGVMTIEIFPDSMKVITDGKSEESWRIPLTIKVLPNGLVVGRVSGTYEEPEEFPFPPPPGPIGIGDSWQREVSLGVSIEATVTQTFTLTSIDRSTGEAIARIQSRIEGAVKGSPRARGVQTRVSGTARGTGEILWSLDRGRLLKETETTNMEVESEATAEGQTIRVKLTMSLNERRELMAQLPGAQLPSPDALIVPGKSLGQLALGISMSELTARFGQPAPEPDLGLRSRRLRWSSGLVAHVHANDPSRVLGLEITDRQYRTEKGIGYRSSEGAVLMAYGFEPARSELISISLGDYRVLVYDSLGIAFGIHLGRSASLRRQHPPPWTVEFVVIFTPGTASSIFGP